MPEPRGLRAKSPCRCHSGLLYNGLTTCPACGHNSLDRGRTWEGCERRACGYQKTLTAGQTSAFEEFDQPEEGS